MKVLLIDVDSKIPNLVLMKLSTYHKKIWDTIDFIKLNLSYYPHKKHPIIDAFGYDLVYCSIIFKNNKNSFDIVNIKESKIKYGGVGYSLKIKLIEDIERLNPDYSLYPENDTSYGFLTRGCIRNCHFCVVPEKEGLIKQVANIQDIVKHKKVKFLDNNILSLKNNTKIFKELINKKIRCQFNQGLDIRLLNEESAKLLSEMNYLGEYIFAFDNIKDEELITNNLIMFKKYLLKDWKCKFFIYCHPDMDIQSDILYRIKWCLKNKVLPYFMRDQECWSSKNDHFFKDLAAWCNQPSLFKNMNFTDFMLKRTNNKNRQESSIKLYYK